MSIEIQHRVVLCFGGRNFLDDAKVNAALTACIFDPATPNTKWAVLHGGATGADRLCGQWARIRNVPVLEVRAYWETLGREAGTVRNQWMLDYGRPHYAIGFPGGPGTRDMSRRVQAAGIPVWLPFGLEMYPDAH